MVNSVCEGAGDQTRPTWVKLGWTLWCSSSPIAAASRCGIRGGQPAGRSDQVNSAAGWSTCEFSSSCPVVVSNNISRLGKVVNQAINHAGPTKLLSELSPGLTDPLVNGTY